MWAGSLVNCSCLDGLRMGMSGRGSEANLGCGTYFDTIVPLVFLF